MPYKGTYTSSVDQSCFKSVEKCSIFIIFKCLHDAVSKMCRFEFSFQNLPFSKCAGKKCAVFVWTGGLSVTFFTVFKICRHRVNAVLYTWTLASTYPATRPQTKVLLSIVLSIFLPYPGFQSTNLNVFSHPVLCLLFISYHFSSPCYLLPF